MISQISSFMPQAASRLASAATLSVPTRLDAFLATTAAAPPPSTSPAMPAPAPAKPHKSVGTIALKTLIGAFEGGLGGYVGGTLGGVIGAFAGLASGGGLGWSAGAALGLHLAEKTGQGKVNPIAGGIGALALPLAGGFVGATIGATVGAVLSARGMPLQGALVGGCCALAAELIGE